jgi:hypothetical protein
LQNFKKAHDERKNELKIGQQEELATIIESHNNNLENARRKYQERLSKMEN